MAFDFAKRDRLAQWFDGSQIDSGPIAFLCSRISIRRPNYFRDPDNSFVLAAMIEKDFIILLHSAQIVARCVIAHTSPTGLALRDKVRPRIRRRFLFHEPIILHAYISTACIIVVIPSEVEESRGSALGHSTGSLDFASLRCDALGRTSAAKAEVRFGA